MARLILDSLFPPPPDQLVADLNAVGADGAAVYVWRPGGVGTWTPGHVTALRAAGKLAFPVIVPQSDGGDINGMLGAVKAFGFQDGPITVDQEPPNLPPASWEENFDSASAALGFEGFDYGTSANLGLYQPDDQNWVANWIRTGELEPLPALPAGATGWQFVNDITINGHQYDASVIADSVFGGVPVSVSFPAHDEAEGLVDFLYAALLHRLPATPADREGWVTIAMNQGLFSLVDQFVTNPDIVAEQATINQLLADYRAGKLGSASPPAAPLVQHDHTVTLPGVTFVTGPAVET